MIYFEGQISRQGQHGLSRQHLVRIVQHWIEDVLCPLLNVWRKLQSLKKRNVDKTKSSFRFEIKLQSNTLFSVEFETLSQNSNKNVNSTMSFHAFRSMLASRLFLVDFDHFWIELHFLNHHCQIQLDSIGETLYCFAYRICIRTSCYSTCTADGMCRTVNEIWPSLGVSTIAVSASAWCAHFISDIEKMNK